MSNEWSEQDLKLLADNAQKMSTTELESLLGRSGCAIRTKASRVGISLRAPRKRLGPIKCACGCGEIASGRTKEGKARRYIHGHNVPSGPEHQNWNGGRSTVGGYVVIRKPDHPRAHGGGYVFEHLLVAEQAMGKPVPLTADVHHVNGDKKDNRPQNLVVCEDRAYHHLLHSRQRALDACGNADAHRCWICRDWDVASDTFTARTNGSSYHKDCAARYARMKRTMSGRSALEKIRDGVDLEQIAEEMGDG